MMQPTTTELHRLYEENGYALIKGVFSPEEVEEIRRNVTRYDKHVRPALPQEWARYESNGSTRGLYFLEQVDPFFQRLAQRPELQRIANEATGEPAEFWAVETFHKQPRVGSAALPHQDGIYYVGKELHAVNMWLSIDAARSDNGALFYWPGTHRNGIFPHVPTPDDDGLQWIADAYEQFGEPVLVETDPGDVLIHHEWSVHGSAANESDRGRLAIVIAWTLPGTDSALFSPGASAV